SPTHEHRAGRRGEGDATHAQAIHGHLLRAILRASGGDDAHARRNRPGGGQAHASGGARGRSGRLPGAIPGRERRTGPRAGGSQREGPASPSHARAGTVEIAAPRVNDRRVNERGERQRFTSEILPPYMRRSPKVAEVLPVLYLRGLSTGDFKEALPALLGEDAAGLSPSANSRLLAVWEEEYRSFRQRDLSDRD